MDMSFNIQYDCINLSLLDYNLLISPCKAFLNEYHSLPNKDTLENSLEEFHKENDNETDDEIFTIDEVKIAGYQSENFFYDEF